MKIRIHVTKEVLQETMWCGTGRNGGCAPNTAEVLENCAIAYAVREIFPNAQVSSHITIDPDKCYLPDVILPKKAKRFIDTFDSFARECPQKRANIHPISFDINVPDDVLEEVISVNEVHRILSESKTLELIAP